MSINVVQVGYGYWGANISQKILHSKKFNFLALCEKDLDRQIKAKDDLPESVIICEDYHSYLYTQTVDAFIIATETEASFEIGMDAMRAGKHVFMEKPIATTVERAEKLKETSEKSDVVLHCDHIMIYNPYCRYIKSLYESGALGDLIYIDVETLNLGPIRKDINALMDLAVHDIALIDWLSEGSQPLEISAFGRAPFGTRETLTYLTMQYENFIAHIKSSWISPLKVRQRVIAGTKKMVIFNDLSEEKVKVYDRGIDVIPNTEYFEYAYLTRNGDVYIPHIKMEDSLQNSLEHFATCIENGSKSLSGAEQSLRVMRVLARTQEVMVS